YIPDGSYTETGTVTAANGSVVNHNTFSYNNASYWDSWSAQDGSSGNYTWTSSLSEYQESCQDSNGTTWTDDYHYAPGGSPASGGSFSEDYASSDGSHGHRAYDASTGITFISWDSTATGTVSGTISGDAGFVGLLNDGGLIN